MNKSEATLSVLSCQAAAAVPLYGTINHDLAKHYLDSDTKYTAFRYGSVTGLQVHHQDYDIIAFRGSDDLIDWGINFAALPKNGFHRGYYKMSEYILDILPQSLTRPFIITGYSLGGAITTILSYELCSHPLYKSSYTFGSPKVVSSSLKKKYEQKLSGRLHRVRRYNDAVTYVPIFSLYTHVGNPYYIDKTQSLNPGTGPAISPAVFTRYDLLKIKSYHALEGYADAVLRL